MQPYQSVLTYLTDVRALYKDLVCLVQSDQLISNNRLRAKVRCFIHIRSFPDITLHLIAHAMYDHNVAPQSFCMPSTPEIYFLKQTSVTVRRGRTELMSRVLGQVCSVASQQRCYV